MRDDGFYDRDELFSLGFSAVGTDALVSRKACFYAFRGVIGDYTRIDDFAIIKGRVDFGRFVHVSAYCIVAAVHGRVLLDDCAGLSSGVAVYTASDDYRASVLNNPTVPPEFSRTIAGDVTFGVGCLIGAHSVVLPNAVVGDGASVGAFALVRGVIEPGDIVVSAAGRLRVVGNRDAAHIRELRDELVRQKCSPGA